MIKNMEISRIGSSCWDINKEKQLGAIDTFKLCSTCTTSPTGERSSLSLLHERLRKSFMLFCFPEMSTNCFTNLFIQVAHFYVTFLFLNVLFVHVLWICLFVYFTLAEVQEQYLSIAKFVLLITNKQRSMPIFLNSVWRWNFMFRDTKVKNFMIQSSNRSSLFIKLISLFYSIV